MSCVVAHQGVIGYNVCMDTLTYTQPELEAVAEKLLLSLSGKKTTNQATVLALSGNLGAGKTTLVQALAAALSVSEQITSPTFVVMKRYQAEHPTFFELIHIDAYRIEQEEEMVVLGFLQWLKNPQALICIEWPEKINGLIPATAATASLTVIDEQTREMRYG